MNAEQLNSARLARWSQNGEARLTQEAAAEWLQTVGFCPYLPMGSGGNAPSASFLEAVVGRPAAAPSAGERARALSILARLIENSSAVPLKLGNSLGEQPDFVVSQDVLAYVVALRGDRNFKTGPSTVGNDKVTTLAQHCWQAIERHGPLDVGALQPVLGRDITEAAIVRALQELWSGLYVFPVLSATGQPAQWELLARRFPGQTTTGARTGQAESLSAVVSLYLHAAVAAMEDEILAFLSPLAPQSKLREVIRGLGSMRQLDILDIDGRSHVCLQGGLLPEMVAQLSELQLAASSVQPELEIERDPQVPQPNQQQWIGQGLANQQAGQARPRGDSDEPKRFAPKKFVPKKFAPKKFVSGQFAARASGSGRDSAREDYSKGRSDARSDNRPGGARFGKHSGAAGPYRSVEPRSAQPNSKGPRSKGFRSSGDYPPRPRSFQPRDRNAPSPVVPGRGVSSFDARPPATRGLGERAKRWEKSGEGAGARSARDRKPYAQKPSGFKPKAGFKSSSFQPAGSKPWASKGVSRGGATKPWTNRSSSRLSDSSRAGKPGERPKPWERSGAGAGGRQTDRKPYAGGSTEGKPAKFKPSGYTASGFKSAGSKAAESGSFGSKPGGFKSPGSKPWVSRGAASRVGSARSYVARSADKPFPKTSGAKPWVKQARVERDGAESGHAGEKPRRKERSDASAGKKSGSKPFWSKNPRGGKGSAPASRTNRPRGKSGGKKSGKKK